MLDAVGSEVMELEYPKGHVMVRLIVHWSTGEKEQIDHIYGPMPKSEVDSFGQHLTICLSEGQDWCGPELVRIAREAAEASRNG